MSGLIGWFRGLSAPEVYTYGKMEQKVQEKGGRVESSLASLESIASTIQPESHIAIQIQALKGKLQKSLTQLQGMYEFLQKEYRRGAVHMRQSGAGQTNSAFAVPQMPGTNAAAQKTNEVTEHEVAQARLAMVNEELGSGGYGDVVQSQLDAIELTLGEHTSFMEMLRNEITMAQVNEMTGGGGGGPDEVAVAGHDAMDQG